MKRIGVAIHILVLLGSMKYIEHKATNSMVSHDSFLLATTIDSDLEPIQQVSMLPFQSSQHLSLPEPPLHNAWSDEIEEQITKLEKLYVLQKMLSNRMHTDIVPDYSSCQNEDPQELVLASTEEMAYAIDAQVDEEPIVIQGSCAAHVKLLLKESKDTIFLIVAHVQDRTGKPLEIINLILNSDGSVAAK